MRTSQQKNDASTTEGKSKSNELNESKIKPGITTENKTPNENKPTENQIPLTVFDVGYVDPNWKTIHIVNARI